MDKIKQFQSGLTILIVILIVSFVLLGLGEYLDIDALKYLILAILTTLGVGIITIRLAVKRRNSKR